MKQAVNLSCLNMKYQKIGSGWVEGFKNFYSIAHHNQKCCFGNPICKKKFAAIADKAFEQTHFVNKDLE